MKVRFKSLLLSTLLGLSVVGAPALTCAAEQVTSPSLSQSEFERWLGGFKTKALAQGIRSELLQQVFADLRPDPSIIQADGNQPEHVRQVWQYIDGAISPWRVARGKALLAQYRQELDAIEQQYQVDRHILVAIWGLESNFGKNTGNKNIIRSLATLAAQGRRSEFWENQLLAALRIVQSGDISHQDMLGSWAGAMGHTQFMPGTYLEYAVDFDGDGKRDIWHSAPDALASTANYLRKSGWNNQIGWGYEARLPALFEHMQADGKQRKTIAQWIKLGVELRQKQPLSEQQLAHEATIILPAGYRGPAFVQPDNFRSLLKYNLSTSYVLAVGLMSNSLRDSENFSLQRWPVEEHPLTKNQRFELQEILNQLGYASGKADGILGSNTQQAIRQFQHDNLIPADGFPSLRLLEKMRQRLSQPIDDSDP